MTPLPELRLLRSFRAVCESGSLSRAAEGLHISQQALSQQLRQLEGLLGVELIERTNRGAVPTPAGRTLLVEARKVLIAAERAVERTLQTAAGQGGSLRLGHSLTTSSDLVPAITERLASAAPGLQLSTIEMLARELPGALGRGEVDVALIPHADHGDHVDTSPAATVALCAAVAAGDPLADEPHVSLEQLSGRTVHLWPRDVAPGYHDAVVEAFTAAGVTPSLDTSVVGNAVWARIARGPGVGVIAVSQVPSLPRAIATISIVPAPPPMGIDLAWRRGDAPASLATIQQSLAEAEHASDRTSSSRT